MNWRVTNYNHGNSHNNGDDCFMAWKWCSANQQVCAGAGRCCYLAQLQNPEVLMKESLTVTFLAETCTDINIP